MQAITIDQGHVRFQEDWPDPVPSDTEVLVEVTRAGICETDLQLARGYMGFSGVLGHEFVGIARSGRFKGQRVVGEINCNCGQCPRCEKGLGNHCGNRTVVGIDRHDGAFAQFVAIPQANLHQVPENVVDDEAVLVEPLAAALRIGEQVSFCEADEIAILGDGRLAYLSALAIRPTAAHITVVGKHPSKLDRFRVAGLATTSLLNLPPEKSFDLVVDCTGSEGGLPLALRLVRPRGTVVMKTTVASEHQLSLAPIVIDEITLVGSRCGPFDKAIEALHRKEIDVSGLITHRYQLEDVDAALASAVDPSAFKVVFEIAPSRG